MPFWPSSLIVLPLRKWLAGFRGSTLSRPPDGISDHTLVKYWRDLYNVSKIFAIQTSACMLARYDSYFHFNLRACHIQLTESTRCLNVSRLIISFFNPRLSERSYDPAEGSCISSLCIPPYAGCPNSFTLRDCTSLIILKSAHKSLNLYAPIRI